MLYLMAGLAGAIIGAQLRDGGIELPSIQSIKNGTGKRLCLGGLVGLIAGAVTGMYANHTVWNAAIYGFAGTVLIEQAGNKIINSLGGK